jgi:hypothetical protein
VAVTAASAADGERAPAATAGVLLDTVECCGPNGRRPGIVTGTGAEMAAHDLRWPRLEHRTAMLRVK